MIISDSCFCLTEETHFWVAMIIDAVRSGVFLRILGQLPWLKGILMHMIPKDIMEKRKQHVDYSRDALREYEYFNFAKVIRS